jgi:thioesterase domain-containing protein/acyl carrier protein
MKRAEGSEGMLGVVTSIFGEEAIRLGAVVPGSVPASAHILSMFAGYGWTIVPFEIRRQQGQIGSWLMQAGVRVFIVVPTVLRQVTGSLEPGQVIPCVQFVGIFGETTTWEDVGQLRAHLEPGAIIFNVYAQSEAGDIALMAVGPDTVIGTGRLPVGKPIEGREVVIVGDDGEPVPDGEEGEIVVRSRSAAAGYWDEGPAESQVFFPQPDGATVVHTRDRGRIGPGGLLEHLGRIDHMVKIAGNRVDLGEIEAALRSYHWVSDAAATVYTSANGELRLRAFVVMEESRIANPRSLRGWLVQRLPRPAVPDIVEVLDELPMLPNGKVDRSALPAQRPRLRTAGDEADGGGQGAVNGSAGTRGATLLANNGVPIGGAPNAGPMVDIALPELEATLVGVWGDVLGLDDLGPEDDFFGSGGDSLRAVSLVAAVSEELGLEVPLWLLLEHTTPRSMALALRSPQVLSPVVTIKGDGRGLPLFVVHDTYGSLFGARHYLDAVNLDQPILGIRAAAWEKTAPVEPSLEALASHYADDICHARPRGAFCLYGQDTAAMIAFELGRQLLERGRTVALLVVGSEITPPKPLQVIVQNRLNALKQLPAERLPSEALNLASHAAHGAATRVRRWARSRQSRQALSARGAELVEIPLEDRADRARSYYRDLVRAYRPPGKYHGSVLVVTAPWMDKDATVRWSHWVDGPLRISDPAAFLHDLDGPARVVENLAP